MPSDSDGFCIDCERRLPRWRGPIEVEGCDAVVGACRFSDLARDLVHRLKYGRDTHPGPAMADLLAGVCADDPRLGVVDAVVPVPLSRRRLLTRGFNQAQFLADGVASRLVCANLPRLLRRIRHSRPQAGLPRDVRLANLEGTFLGAPASWLRAVLVVDDVMTTGSTLREAARALKAAGARRVFGAAFAIADLTADRGYALPEDVAPADRPRGGRDALPCPTKGTLTP